jgi:uncharacterized membrane protein
MWKVITTLSLIGIVLAVYLLFEQITHSPFQPCNINSIINCNAVISGEVSKTLGIPTPLYGLVGYSIIFISSLLKRKKLLCGVVIFGLLFCLWIAYQELFLLHVICPVCIICQVCMITIFIISLFLNFGKSSIVTS